MEIVKTCPVCGRIFTAYANATKYCSPECRIKGRADAIQAWQLRTGYKEKKRLSMQQKRAEDRKAINQRRAKAARIQHEKAREIETERKKKRSEDLMAQADAGDLTAQMILACDRGNMLEYWRLRKAMYLNSNNILNVGNTNIQEEDFEYKVMAEVALKRKKDNDQ